MAKSYAEKLRDPRWQRRRLEILEKAGYRCSVCDCSEKTLHVHHGYYARGCDPWDYPDDSLHVLCEDCHFEAEETRAELYRVIGFACPTSLQDILGFAIGITGYSEPDRAIKVDGYEIAFGLGAAFGLSAEEVIGALENNLITLEKLFEMRRVKKSHV